MFLTFICGSLVTVAKRDANMMACDLTKFVNHVVTHMLPMLSANNDDILYFHHDNNSNNTFIQGCTRKSEMKEGSNEVLSKIVCEKLLSQEIEPNHRTLIISMKVSKTTMFTIFENTSSPKLPSTLAVTKMWTIIDV